MPVYSYSRLSTYKQCAYKYRLKYIDRVKEDMQTIETFMGKRVHESLERLYKNLISAKIIPLADLLVYYNRQWEKEWEDDLKVVKKDRSSDDYRQLEIKCIEDYYKAHYPFNESRTIGVEKKVYFTLDESGRYKMGGVIDRLAISPDGAYEIHDYKTNGNLPTQLEKDLDKQLALYQIAIQNMWTNTGSVTLHWHYLVFNQRISSTRTDEAIKRLRIEKITLIDEIETATEFLPHESVLCDWCGYQKICPLRKHKVVVDALPEAEKIEEEGFQLVDRLEILQLQKKEIETKIDETKDALIAYSEKEQVDRIFGSFKVAKIKSEEKLSFPESTDKRRVELEEAVKETGRWSEVASLDLRKLGKVIEEDKWDAESCEKIEQFIEREDRKSVTLVKKKEREN